METKGAILVVDSENIVQMMLESQLVDAGFVVALVGDTREAIERMKTEQFDVAMVDKDLPDGDGFDLIRTMRDMDPDLEVIMMTSYGSFESALEAMDAGVFDYLTKPFDQLALVAQRVRRAVERRSRRRQLQSLVGSLEESNRQLIESMNELETAYLDTAQVISRILLMRSPSTADETERVQALAVATARRLSVPNEAERWLAVAAALRDVGKIGTIEEIAGKPSSLTAKEQGQLREHPDIAARLLDAVAGYRPLAEIIRHQNERFDGSGYPDGLEGDSIPLESRILGVATAYVAMTSERPYRKAKTPGEVQTELRAATGSQFDPLVVKQFFAVLAAEQSRDHDDYKSGDAEEKRA